MAITSNPLFRMLKKTIDSTSSESLEKSQVCIGKGKIVSKLEPMDDGYVDDLEIGGTTLFAEKNENEPMATDDIRLGGTKRYLPRTMAKKVSISEEALEDNKYKDALKISQRLVASAYKIQDIDIASIVLNCTANAGDYDNVVLASTAHTIPGSSATYSNYLNAGLGMSPSPQALMQMRNMATLMLGPNGMVDSLELEALTFPDIQTDVWKVILGSANRPGSDWNDINTVKDYGLKQIPVKWYDAINTSIWAGLTSAKEGIKAFQKRKITSNTWVDNDATVAHHGCSYRMAMGWSNPRHFILGDI